MAIRVSDNTQYYTFHMPQPKSEERDVSVSKVAINAFETAYGKQPQIGLSIERDLSRLEDIPFQELNKEVPSSKIWAQSKRQKKKHERVFSHPNSPESDGEETSPIYRLPSWLCSPSSEPLRLSSRDPLPSIFYEADFAGLPKCLKKEIPTEITFIKVGLKNKKQIINKSGSEEMKTQSI